MSPFLQEPSLLLSWVPLSSLWPLPVPGRERAVGLTPSLSVGGWCGPNIPEAANLAGVFPPPSSPDSLLSQQPSEDLVPYDTDLYQRQTHEYYPYLSSDGESHSGESWALPPPTPQPAVTEHRGGPRPEVSFVPIYLLVQSVCLFTNKEAEAQGTK